MGRFDHLATQPRRGPREILKWKVVDALAGRNRKDPGGFAAPRAEPDQALIRSGEAQLTWIGHASFLFTLAGKRFLVDPVFSERLGPGVARLAPPGVPIGDLPGIDAVLVTHNHRDHFDEWSLRRLGKGPRYVVPLGNGDLLRKLGAEHVDELDWWQSTAIGGAEVTLVPARHWSMRYPWDRNEALWGGFVIRGPEGALYHSGDTAFFDGFTEIGARLGPIDWAMLPIGAYEPRWFMSAQHMCPEESVEASRMLGARNFVAMHWGTFRLTDEPLAEPPERTRAAFAAAGSVHGGVASDPTPRALARADARLFIPAIGETLPLR
jgi:L-ascorbate metabolism protein UlaG (beta-lactamase superfamily)